jgi:hypothetical protein
MANKIEQNIYINKAKKEQINGQIILKILKSANSNKDIRNLKNNSFKGER